MGQLWIHCINYLYAGVLLHVSLNSFVNQVFGMDKKYWFIPAYSQDDLKRMPNLQGLEYPMRSDTNLLQEL